MSGEEDLIYCRSSAARRRNENGTMLPVDGKLKLGISQIKITIPITRYDEPFSVSSN